MGHANGTFRRCTGSSKTCEWDIQTTSQNGTRFVLMSRIIDHYKVDDTVVNGLTCSGDLARRNSLTISAIDGESNNRNNLRSK